LAKSSQNIVKITTLRERQTLHGFYFLKGILH